MKPWNKNKSVGQKKPFTPKQVRLLKDILESKAARKINKSKNKSKDRKDRKKRKNFTMQLALFSLGIDTMLRSGDLLKLLVEDVTDHRGKIKDEIKIKQQKTKSSHIVMISEQTKGYLENWISKGGKYDDDYLFSFKNRDKPYTTRWHRWIMKSWARLLGLDARDYSTHSLRRTRPTLMYRNGVKHEELKILLGHKSVSSTSRYLNVDGQDAMDIARKYVI